MTNENQDSKQEQKETSEAPGLVLRFRKQIIVLVHIGVFALSLMMAFLLVNNMQFTAEWFLGQYFPKALILFIIIKMFVFALFKQYQGWWRYVSISDLLSIVKASLVSTLVIVITWVAVAAVEPVRQYVNELFGFSQAVFILDMFATIVLMGGLRMAVRLYHENFIPNRQEN
jgi:FlaA1/EpsC-like NDP-sugar epimerase